MASKSDLPENAKSKQALSSGPTRVRYAVLAMGVLLAGITYLDRVSIAQCSESIQRDLGLSNQQMSYVFSAFTLAYALFEIPTGAWGDRVGTRRVLTRIVLWWSSFTIATAGVFSYTSLLVTRFLFGAGEAGAWPNAARTFSRWFPTSERGRAQGIFFMGAHLGGGLTPLLVVALLQVISWRWVFVIFGSIGFLWAAAWFWWFRDEPEEHPAVNGAELDWIVSGRTAASTSHFNLKVLANLLTRRSMIALCIMYFTQTYGFYFFITWLPRYLSEARGFVGGWQGFLAGLPLLLSVAADLFGGLTTDSLTKRFGLRLGRCGVGAASLLVAGLAMSGAALSSEAWTAALLIALAGASANFLLGAAWGVCLDVAGPHTGVVTACMNTAGQIGGVLSPIVLARFLGTSTGPSANWHTPLLIIAGLYFLGAFCWLLVDPYRPLVAHPSTLDT